MSGGLLVKIRWHGLANMKYKMQWKSVELTERVLAKKIGLNQYPKTAIAIAIDSMTS